jgi:hypothetical protein
MDTKTCRKCGLSKPLDEFHGDPSKKDGRKNTCKACRAIENSQRYYRNSDPSTKRLYKAVVVGGKKKCKECGQEKLLEDFAKDKRKINGRTNTCKECTNREVNQRKHRGINSSKRRYTAVAVDGKKRCKNCGDKKLLEEFVKSSSGKLGYSNICRFCNNAKKKQDQSNFYGRVALFLGGRCKYCGLETPWYEIYECHHENPEEKEYNISGLRHKDWDTVVVPELRKCILVCANCHSLLESQIARLRPNRTRDQMYKYAKKDQYKQRCVEYISGGCQICGLETNDFSKYDFHHVIPYAKQFCISDLTCKDWDSIVRPELNKCALLCRNCHKSFHFGRYDDLILIPGPKYSVESAKFSLDKKNNNSYTHDIGRGENRLGVYTASF